MSALPVKYKGFDPTREQLEYEQAEYDSLQRLRNNSSFTAPAWLKTVSRRLETFVMSIVEATTGTASSKKTPPDLIP